jgi:pyruvate dehydrogenase (quinone)
MAEGAGLLGLTAETPAKVRPMVAQALWHDSAALGEVLVSRQDLSKPPTITAEQVKGFGLFTLKVLLSGRGDEINDLAKINILR